MKVTETLRMYRYPRTVQFRLYSIGWDHTTRSFLSGAVVSRLNSHMFSSLTLWFQYESLLCQFFHAIWGELPTETANSALDFV